MSTSLLVQQGDISGFRVRLRSRLKSLAEKAGDAVDAVEEAGKVVSDITATADQIHSLVSGDVLDIASAERLLLSKSSGIESDVADAAFTVLRRFDTIGAFFDTGVPPEIEEHARELARLSPTRWVSGVAREHLFPMFLAIFFDETLSPRYAWNEGMANPTAPWGVLQLTAATRSAMKQAHPELPDPSTSDGIKAWNAKFVYNTWTKSVDQTPLPAAFENKLVDPSVRNIVKFLAAHRGGAGWRTLSDALDIEADVAERFAMIVGVALNHRRRR